jgi:SRSO17 transposase
VLAVSPDTTVFTMETVFAVPERREDRQGRQKTRPRPDQKPLAIGALVAGLDGGQWQTVTFRDGPDDQPMTSRFCFLRIRAGNDWENAKVVPREEWLIAEWPDGHDKPLDYWIANLPGDTDHERLARLARLRWKIELDYKQLKGELGLDHYEGRSWLGWYHHTALVTAAHGFMTLERQHPNHQRPA